MKAVTSQRKQLYRLFGYSKETEFRHVQQITGDPAKTAAKDLSIAEAKKLIESLTTNWAVFDTTNNRHMYILSLMRQLGWTKQGAVMTLPDMAKLSTFLKSHRSPVQKPLQEMTAAETSKIIVALEGIVKSDYK